jgi:hypothetical protein
MPPGSSSTGIDFLDSPIPANQRLSANDTTNWRIDLLEVLRPKQPTQSIRKAHFHDHVLFAPISANDLADHPPPLWEPVLLAHLHLHAKVCYFRPHASTSVARSLFLRSIGFWAEVILKDPATHIHQQVLQVVGAGSDHIAHLLIGERYGRVFLYKVIPNEGEERLVVFGFLVMPALAP